MRKFLSIKSLMLFALTTTALVSCKEDKLNVIDNPLIFSETSLTIQQFTSKTISVTNSGIDLTKVIYVSSRKNIATIENGVITALAPGETSISAFVEGQYLSTLNTTNCKVTVTNIAPTGIKFVTAVADFSNVPLNLEKRILFDVSPQNAACDIEVNSSDTVLRNITYTIKMAPGNSPDPDTLVMSPIRVGDLNLTLGIKGSKLVTAKATVNISDVRPNSMVLYPYNSTDSIETNSPISSAIELAKGESVIIWTKFDPIDNSYTNLKTLLNTNDYIEVASETVTFKRAIADGKFELYTRPGLKITAIGNIPLLPAQTNMTVLNNSGLQVAQTITVEAGTMLYTQTIKVPVAKVTLQSTANNVSAKTTLALPTFDNGNPDSKFTITPIFIQLKDKEGDNLPMLEASDFTVNKEWTGSGYIIAVRKSNTTTNQGFASVIMTAVDDQNAPLTDKAGEIIRDTMLVEIPVDVWFNPDVEYKQAFTFNNPTNQYSVRLSVLLPSSDFTVITACEATLYRNTYKTIKDKNDKDKVVFDKEIEVATTQLTKSSQGIEMFTGTFAPFVGQVDDKSLEDYFVKYEMTANQSSNTSSFTNIVKTIIPDDGFVVRNVK